MSGTMMPIISWKIEVSHCPVVRSILNSSTIVGSALVSCSCVKFPTNVMKVRIPIEIRAGLLSFPPAYASLPVRVACLRFVDSETSAFTTLGMLRFRIRGGNLICPTSLHCFLLRFSRLSWWGRRLPKLDFSGNEERPKDCKIAVLEILRIFIAVHIAAHCLYPII